MRPLAIAHEGLCRRGQEGIAGKWRDFIAERTKKLAAELLEELAKREAKYGIRLRSVRDRLEERFQVPLHIDRAAAQVPAAAAAARAGEGEDNPAFARLLAAVKPLAETVSGVGLEVPVWVRRLEESLRHARDGGAPDRDAAGLPAVRIDFAELKRQLADWDRPLGE
jgi:hypothetical protein